MENPWSDDPPVDWIDIKQQNQINTQNQFNSSNKDISLEFDLSSNDLQSNPFAQLPGQYTPLDPNTQLTEELADLILVPDQATHLESTEPRPSSLSFDIQTDQSHVSLPNTDTANLDIDSKIKFDEIKVVVQEPVIPNPLFNPYPSNLRDNDYTLDVDKIEALFVDLEEGFDDNTQSIIKSESKQKIDLTLTQIIEINPIQDKDMITCNINEMGIEIPSPTCSDPLGVTELENIFLSRNEYSPDQSNQSDRIDPTGLVDLTNQNKETDITTNPTFQVQVLDPTKVGDKVSGYIEYRVKTLTNSLKYLNNQVSVMRRYSDFLWLYNQLLSIEIGFIIPGIPEKVALGRFQDEFIEARRLQLEQFIRKILSHHHLKKSPILQLFLESQTFAADKKSNTLKTILGSNTTPLLNQMFPSMPDQNEYLDTQRTVLIQSESQIKVLLRSFEMLNKQRLELANAMHEMGEGFTSLGISQSNTVAQKTSKISEIHKLIKSVYDQQVVNDTCGICATALEYLRTIGSIKLAYQIRNKVYHALATLESILSRKQEAYTKFQQTVSVRSDKIAYYKREVSETEMQVERDSIAFKRLTDNLENDLSQFEGQRVCDIKDGLALFVNNLFDAQRQVLLILMRYY